MSQFTFGPRAAKLSNCYQIVSQRGSHVSTSSLLSTNRRVAVFVTAGILIAALTGFSVWKFSTPSPPSDPIRPASVETPEPPSTSLRPSPSISLEETTPPEAHSPLDTTSGYADDSFLAPHAWTEPQSSSVSPTRVYRPTNPGTQPPERHPQTAPEAPTPGSSESSVEPTTPDAPSISTPDTPPGTTQPDRDGVKKPNDGTDSPPPRTPPPNPILGSMSHPRP